MVGKLRYFLRLVQTGTYYVCLNVAGLSVGMACFILIGLFLRHEFTFDRHNDNHQHIYRVNHQIDATNNVTRHARTSHFLGPLLLRDYPEIENYVSFRRESPNATLLRYGAESYYVDDLYIADNSVFEIFSHDIIYGEVGQALLRPNTIAIDQSLAQRLFGDENPVGRIVSTGVVDYELTLVFADLPGNAHFQYSALIANAGNFAPSADALANRRGNLWNLNGFTYLQMNSATPLDGSEVFEDFYSRMMADVTRPGYTAQFFLEPLADIHLNSVALQDEPRGNAYYLYALAVVGTLILVSACFNYINMATARAFTRGREVAMRKILGAERSALLRQFLAESMLYAFLALLLAIVMVQIALLASTDLNLFGRSFDTGFWRDPQVFVGLIALGTAVGLLAGIYPALQLTRLQAISRAGVEQASGRRLRGSLVLAQFTISIAVISATLLMFNQLNYMDGMAIGMDKDNKLLLRVQGADAIERTPALLQTLRDSPFIEEVSLSVGNPVTGNYTAALEAQREDGSVYNLEYNYTPVDETYFDTLGLQLLAGRGFETGQEAELRQVVVNQAVSAEVGWSDPIGKVFTIGGSPEFTVIGELRDFRFEDIHSRIKPFVFFLDDLDFQDWSDDRRVGAVRELIVAIDGDNVPEALRFIEQAWADFDSVYPLQYQFLADVMEQMRVSDNRQMYLIAVFAAICVFISCLGLLGLTAFTIHRKAKEIAIRKTLGASTGQIIRLLFGNVLKLLALASIVASVIAYLAINRWLEGFYYRDAMDPSAFLLAAVSAVLIALLTLSLQSYRSAARNPVVSLRYE